MSDAWTPLLVLAGVVLGPVLLAYITGRQRRAERREDWARQDLVAARAAEDAAELLAANKSIARAATATNEKLDVVHVLVDGAMTAAMRAEVDATIRELAGLGEIIALNRAAGREPSARAIAAELAASQKIEELERALAVRLEQIAKGPAN